MTEQELRQAIKDRMEDKGTSYWLLAKEVDRVPKTLYNWLKGTHSTRVDTLVVLCDALGLEVIIREKEESEEEE